MGGATSVQVDGATSVQVGGATSVQVGGACSVQVSGATNVQVGGACSATPQEGESRECIRRQLGSPLDRTGASLLLTAGATTLQADCADTKPRVLLPLPYMVVSGLTVVSGFLVPIAHCTLRSLM